MDICSSGHFSQSLGSSAVGLLFLETLGGVMKALFHSRGGDGKPLA